MSHTAFQFVPVAAARRKEIVALDDAFTSDEVETLCHGLRGLALEDAMVGPDEARGFDYDMRNSRIAWLAHDHHSAWIYGCLMRAVQRANLDFCLDVWGIAEHLQVAEYAEGGHYCWHKDSGMSPDETPRPPRKVSFTVQLSHPDEYEGGDLEFLLDSFYKAPRERGSVVLFPSYTPHRVDFVTAGVRRSLTGWACGQDFR